MSFKRDGDDTSLLGNLRKRRINELLGEDIPKDEALLLSNGRYTCLVCNHRPIFDTVNMLAIHRKGKKHTTNEQFHRKKQEELKELIQKRKQEQFLEDGTANIQQAKVYNRGLGLGAPYDPRVKKQKLHDRKLKLEVNDNTISDISTSSNTTALSDNRLMTNGCFKQFIRNVDKNCVHKPSVSNKTENVGQVSDVQTKAYTENVHAGSAPSCHGNSHADILKEQMKGTFSHLKQLNKIFYKPSENIGHVQPYRSKRHRIKLTDTTGSASSLTSCTEQNNGRLSHGNSDIDRKNNEFVCDNAKLDTTVADKDQLMGLKYSNLELDILQNIYPPPPPPPPPQQLVSAALSESRRSFSDPCDTRTQSTLLKDGVKNSQISTSEIKTLEYSVTEQDVDDVTRNSCKDVTLEERKFKAETYLHYRGAGWKKDLSGNWVKDEDAEFDSDEEPPDLP